MVPRISVVVPTYKRSESLRDTIVSLQGQAFPEDEYEIIVVNNNPKDSTSAVVEECNRNGEKGIIYIEEPHIGAHNARHAGARVAKGEILAYVDDDIICDKNWLYELVKPYSNPEVGCVGGKILPKWAIVPPVWIEQYRSFLSLLDLGDEVKELDKPNIWGCNFSINRSLLFDLGGFHPDAIGDRGLGDRRLIWLRGDGEIGLLNKVLKAKKKVIYTPYAVVWHVIPQSRLTLDYLKKRAFIEGISASFTAYRAGKFGRFRPFYRIFIFCSVSIICKVLSLLNRIIKKSNGYVKYEIAYSSFKSRFMYEFRLIYDKKLRAHIRKDSWL